MKKAERLFRLIGNVKDEYILEAEAGKEEKNNISGTEKDESTGITLRAVGKQSGGSKRKIHWHIWAAAAAALVLVVGVAGTSWNSFRMGNSSGIMNGEGRSEGTDGAEGTDGSAAGADGAVSEDGSSVFMSYAGPVLPLTVQQGAGDESGQEAEDEPEQVADDEIGKGAVDEPGQVAEDEPEQVTDDEIGKVAEGKPGQDSNGITAVRDIVWDYQFMDGEASYMKVTDGYELTNTSTEDIEVMAYYPYAGRIRELEEVRPTIEVNGQQQSTELVLGNYCGGSIGYLAAEREELQISPTEMTSWEQYRELLADGTYLQQALEAPQELNQKLIVYEFSDFEAPLEEYDAATQAIHFNIEEDATQILTYGFNGMDWNQETGLRCYSYFVPDEAFKKETKMLLVLGEDIMDYELMGYKNGDCSYGNELDGVSCKVVRREATLGQIIEEIFPEVLEIYMESDDKAVTAAQETLSIEAIKKALNIILDAKNIEWLKNDWGRLDELLLEPLTMERVMYEAFTVTIPAGETIKISAQMNKQPSFNYYCGDEENAGMDGYDVVTTLGSDLEFTRITAQIQDLKWRDMLRQNFGFDLEQGVMEVELDVAKEHYYMEIGE